MHNDESHGSIERTYQDLDAEILLACITSSLTSNSFGVECTVTPVPIYPRVIKQAPLGEAEKDLLTKPSYSCPRQFSTEKL